mmetsp:Transcript_17049/g.43232  ORF Transcript_17049/g.43232 Transcript_17049/m.43232 type:complete len:222 (+) Transcript_17049:23-688(+)
MRAARVCIGDASMRDEAAAGINTSSGSYQGNLRSFQPQSRCSGLLRRSEARTAMEEVLQASRDEDRAVNLLVSLQDGEDNTRHRNRGAVEGVDKPTRPRARVGIANVESPGLEVSAIGDTRHFTKAAARRHEHLHIKLARRRVPKLVREHIDGAPVQSELVANALLNAAQAIELCRAVLRLAKGEHFDLAELVKAVEAAGGRAGRASLRAEAVAEASQAQR